MTCFYCKGNMVESTTTYMVDLGKCIIIVKNVPCKKCSQCCEIVFDGKVLTKLEQITEQLENIMTEVAVVNYPVNVA
ncbi:MAG: type II toxin-antitoxin system MqsA family antitoxin [Acutalibacteraceae bacterium]